MLGSFTVREVYNFISFYRYLFVLGLFTVGEVNSRYRYLSAFNLIFPGFSRIFFQVFQGFSRVFPEPIFSRGFPGFPGSV